jgi:uncharacterized membrane-anchored protein
LAVAVVYAPGDEKDELTKHLSHTTLFWAAFILTRPLGATVANSFDKSVDQGGLAINDITLSAVFALLMVVCVILIPQRSGRH